jgi:hypothetical protein
MHSYPGALVVCAQGGYPCLAGVQQAADQGVGLLDLAQKVLDKRDQYGRLRPKGY